MKFALVDGNRVEASKGSKGFCPVCNSELIARRGPKKINHWSHKAIRDCDQWWEPETAWHRSWKDNFPKEWQEFLFKDEATGEKHIADIHTKDGLTIEFQHSPITPQEQTYREKFYKNMIWVVDGTRLKKDYPRFIKGKNNFRFVRKGIFAVNFPEEYFPSNWLNSSVPILFDFLGNEIIFDPGDARNVLYCLFHIRIGGSVVFTEIPRTAFLKNVMNGDWLARTQSFINDLTQVSKEKQAQIEREQRLQASAAFDKFFRLKQPRQRRRF